MTAKKTDAASVGQAADDDEPLFPSEEPMLLTEIVSEDPVEEIEPIGEVGSLDALLDEFMERSKIELPKPERIAELASSPVALEDVPRAEPTSQWAVPPPEKTKPLGSFSKGGTAQWDTKPKPTVPIAEQITLDDIDNLIVKGEIRGLDPETDEGSRSALQKLKDDLAGLLSNAIAKALGKPTKPGV